jgi:hypothetical protein
MLTRPVILLFKVNSMRQYISCILSFWMIIGISFLGTAEAFSQTNSAPYVKGMTPGRARALIGVAAGLICLVVGWRARIRSAAGTGKGRTGAIAALLLGLIGIILSVMHLTTSAGAVFGSGSGKAGAIFALVLCLIGMPLGGLALRQKKV